jgi:hypothetical protein
MRKWLTDKLSPNFFRGVGMIVIFTSIIGLLSWRPCLFLYSKDEGVITNVDAILVGGGSKSNYASEKKALKIEGCSGYFFVPFDRYEINRTLVNKHAVVWSKKYNFQSKLYDIYQIEADGKLIYPYDYARSYRKIGWLLLGLFFYRLGSNDRFRMKVLRGIGLLRDDKNP